MKNWQVKNINKSVFEKTGFIPRSIFKIVENLKNKLDPNQERYIMEQLRVSRYQTIASLRYFLFLILSPFLINLCLKTLVLGPLINYCWQKNDLEIFFNASQQVRAIEELQVFEEKLRFNILIGKQEPLSVKAINTKIKNKANLLAKQYNEESKHAVENIFTDALTSTTLITLIFSNKRQLSILSSVFNEILYGLSDTAKSFFIILLTDIFVGYHSSHGWEILLESLLRHFGLPENREFIFLFIASFPVVLDTVFKYWIFRYLNRVSPSAVATYRAMNE